MFGLGTFFLGTVLGIGKVKEVIADANCMSKPTRYLDDGTPIFSDSKSQEWANGEKIVATYDYKNKKLVYAGEKTGKVYIDPEQNAINERKKWDDVYLEDAKKWGYLAYKKYDPRYNRNITTEISTGKPIACLYTDHYGEYRKFYLKGNPHSPSDTQQGDLGILISEEEYNKLNILGGSHSHIPNWDVYYELDKLSKARRGVK